MTFLPLSFLADRLTSAVGTIATKLILSDSRRAPRLEKGAHFTQWPSLPPPHWVSHIQPYNPLEPIHGDGASRLSSAMDTLVEELERYDDYPPHVMCQRDLSPMLPGKILSDFPEYGDLEGYNENLNPSSHSSIPDRIEPDLDRIVAEHVAMPHADPETTSPLTVDPSAGNVAFAKHGNGLLEFPTALSPPPLHLSGKTRSQLIFLPRDTPGSCPVHGCQACGVCDTQNPAIFNL